MPVACLLFLDHLFVEVESLVVQRVLHALERRLNAMGKRLRFGGVGIVCHQFDPQVFQPPGRRTQVFCLTRNPVDKDGNTSAIVEEGRTHPIQLICRRPR